MLENDNWWDSFNFKLSHLDFKKEAHSLNVLPTSKVGKFVQPQNGHHCFTTNMLECFFLASIFDPV
jgi:hypothetical protein